VVETVLELNCGMGGREYLYLEAVGGDNYVSAVFGGPTEKKKGREPQIFSQFLGGNIFSTKRSLHQKIQIQTNDRVWFVKQVPIRKLKK
jgi:hypothetical protein